MGHRIRPAEAILLGSTEESIYMSVIHEQINELDYMNFDEIASFIRSIGIENSWSEAELYSEKFRCNELTGVHMKSLTEHELEVDLGITNGGHRAEILSAIRHRFSVETQTNTDRKCSLAGIETATLSVHMVRSLYAHRAAKYKALSYVLIRVERSVKSKTIGELKKDDVVYFNCEEEECARLFWRAHGGWVSLSSSNGVPLFELIN